MFEASEKAGYKSVMMTDLFKHYRIKINVFVAMVIFLNAIAPLSVIAHEVSNAEGSAREELFGDKILICTPMGFKYISIEELNERQSNGQDGQPYHCPLCLINVAAHILIAVDLSTIFEIENQSSDIQIYDIEQWLISTSFSSAAKPRAPPILL